MQKIFTGVSIQANIALIYLLQNYKRSDFLEIEIKSDLWEDFNLVFEEYTIGYEVKWWERPISQSNLRQIIQKEIDKRKKVEIFRKKNRFKVVVKNLGNQLRKNFEDLKNPFLLSENIFDKFWDKICEEKPIKWFLDRGWTKEQIAFLRNVEYEEFKSEAEIEKILMEHFALVEPFYLDEDDTKTLIAKIFRNILAKGREGLSISKSEITQNIDDFVDNISKKSETFHPDQELPKVFDSIKDFLKSEKEFAKLDDSKYLTPITKRRRSIFYIADKLKENDFRLESIDFFIKKVLLKQDYALIAMDLVEKKWKEGLASTDYLLEFILENYNKLYLDFNMGKAIEIMKEIVENKYSPDLENKILKFLEDILGPLTLEVFGRREKRSWYEEQEILTLIDELFRKTTDKKRIIDFIFSHYDFTGGYFELLMETPPQIYDIIIDYINLDFENNFEMILEKVNEQFKQAYKSICNYKGYEVFGGVTSGEGSDFYVTEKGIVRFLFKPLFEKFYQDESEKSWQFFKKRILDKEPIGASPETPLFLKRSLIHILLKRVVNKQISIKGRNEAFSYLVNILQIKDGLPRTSNIIFQEIRDKEDIFQEMDSQKIMRMIKIDCFKYKREDYDAGTPKNIFTYSVLLKLVKKNYSPARDFLIELFENDNFIKRDEDLQILEMLSKYEIPKFDPDFIVEVFEKINIKEFIEDSDEFDCYHKGKILIDILREDWKEGKDRIKKIIDSFLKGKSPSKKALNFVQACLDWPKKEDIYYFFNPPARKEMLGLWKLNSSSSLLFVRSMLPITIGIIMNINKGVVRIYDIFKEYLENKKIFRKTFQNSSEIRGKFADLGRQLAIEREFDKAKRIVELCIDDPDPETSNDDDDFNYHLKIKKGEGVIIISTVRGQVPWILKVFAVSNKPELIRYALEKTEILLDLDGQLTEKLGYPEPDLYVRMEALIPLMELARLSRRKKLNELEQGLGDKVKELAFGVLESIEKEYESDEKVSKDFLNFLYAVFVKIPDVNTEEAKRIVDFFMKFKNEHIGTLLWFLAEFRDESYPEVPFDSTYFKEKLEEICRTRNPFRKRVVSDFWGMLKGCPPYGGYDFDRVEKYWKLFFEKYQKDVYRFLYYALEISLQKPDKYEEHKELLKKAITTEIEYYKNNEKKAYLWEPGPVIFEILKNRNPDDFLDVFLLILNLKDENIHYSGMNRWLEIYKSVTPNENNKDKYEEIRERWNFLYPEKQI